jgi:hypothetical protein
MTYLRYAYECDSYYCFTFSLGVVCYCSCYDDGIVSLRYGYYCSNYRLISIDDLSFSILLRDAILKKSLKATCLAV